MCVFFMNIFIYLYWVFEIVTTFRCVDAKQAQGFLSFFKTLPSVSIIVLYYLFFCLILLYVYVPYTPMFYMNCYFFFAGQKGCSIFRSSGQSPFLFIDIYVCIDCC